MKHVMLIALIFCSSSFLDKGLMAGGGRLIGLQTGPHVATYADLSMAPANFSRSSSTGYNRSGSTSDEASERDRVRQVILEKARESLLNRYGSDAYRFDVSARWIPGSLVQVPGETILDVMPAGSVDRFTGFDVTYESGGRQRQAQIQLQVEMEQKIPVMGKRVAAGTVITDELINSGWVTVRNDRVHYVSDPAEITGKTLRRTLAMGEPVRKADITTEYLIEAGESVTLSMVKEGMRIDLRAVARQDGSLDDTIRLYSDETRRTYLGKVVNESKVIWQRTL